MRMGVVRRNRRLHLFRGGVVDVVMADLQDRRCIASSHEGRTPHPHRCRVQPYGQGGVQLFRPRQFPRQRIADPDSQRRRRRVILAHNIEMRIEAGEFIDFGLPDPHFLGQRAQMARRQMPELVL